MPLTNVTILKKKACDRLLKMLFFPLVTAGNEDSDVECLKKASMSAVPADACPASQKAASYICRCNGGRGAVREFAEHILLLMEKVNSAGKNLG